MRTSFFNHVTSFTQPWIQNLPNASLARPTGVSLLQSLLHSHYSSDCIIIDVVFLKCPSPVIKSQRSQCIPVYANYRSQPSSLCRLQHRAVWVREVQRPTGEKQTRDAHTSQSVRFTESHHRGYCNVLLVMCGEPGLTSLPSCHHLEDKAKAQCFVSGS